MHKIMLEYDYNPSREHLRRLNPNVKEVVKKDMLKLLEVGIIYPSPLVIGLVSFKLYLRKGG